MAFLQNYMLDGRSNGNLGTWMNEIVKVKTLFQDRNHKRCVTVCEELYRTAKHPIHKAFLKFYQAICYEIMGIRAHNYSSNKLPFLQFAKDSFESSLRALEILRESSDPEAVSLLNKQYFLHTDLNNSYPNEDSRQDLKSNMTPLHHRSTSWSPDSRYSDDIYQTRTFETPTKAVSKTTSGYNTFRVESLQTENPRRDEEEEAIGPNQDFSLSYKARLSRSLSHDRLLEDNFVPTPLFERMRSMVEFAKPESETKSNFQDEAPSRPLPALPFNHKPNFTSKGDRLILRPFPSAKPASSNQATTVTKLMDSTSLPTQSEWPTPVTPRFQYIAQTFAPETKSESPQGVNQDYNRQDSFDSRKPPPSLPLSLAKYHESVIAFHKQVEYHLTSIIDRINDTMRIQHDHKANQTQRQASFWSFKPTSEQTGTVQPRKAATQERIAKLKAGGWQVTKEQHGWKGQAYYDTLRSGAEMELLG